MRSTGAALFATLVAFASFPASAGSLQVEPVLVDVAAPGAASTVTLRNEGAAPINAQIRVFRWSLLIVALFGVSGSALFPYASGVLLAPMIRAGLLHVPPRVSVPPVTVSVTVPAAPTW